MNSETKNLENWFKHYLQLSDLADGEISKVQYTETKRAFFGGIAHTLDFLGNELTKLPEEQAAQELENVKKQTLDFWGSQR